MHDIRALILAVSLLNLFLFLLLLNYFTRWLVCVRLIAFEIALRADTHMEMTWALGAPVHLIEREEGSRQRTRVLFVDEERERAARNSKR